MPREQSVDVHKLQPKQQIAAQPDKHVPRPWNPVSVMQPLHNLSKGSRLSLKQTSQCQKDTPVCQVDFLQDQLVKRDFTVSCMHADLDQKERDLVMRDLDTS